MPAVPVEVCSKRPSISPRVRSGPYGIVRALRLLPPEVLDVRHWPSVDEMRLSPDVVECYRRRRDAVVSYLAGDSLAAIQLATGQSPKQIYRLLDRCTSKHDDGRIYGFRAMLPHVRIVGRSGVSSKKRPYDSKAATRGAFKNLLFRIPNLEAKMEDYVLRFHVGPTDSKPTVEGLQRLVLRECRAASLNEVLDYPFCTQNLLRNVLAKWMKACCAANPRRAATVLAGPRGARLYSTGDGRHRPVFKPFQRVECDAHRLDAIFCIFVPTPYGDLVPVVVERPWVISIVEALTRAHLGYQLSLRSECDSNDVLLAMRNALCPWEPKRSKAFSIELLPNAGYPSSNPDLCGVGWSEFYVDAAKVNHSARLTSKMDELLGAVPHTPTRHNPNDRPVVERLFGTLEEHGFHRLPNTTGSKLDDPRRRNPELKACKYFVTLEVLEVLLDALFANYNGTPHSNLFGRTPLGALDWHIEQNGGVDTLPRVDADSVSRLLTERAVVTVRGDKPYQPHITFGYARYSSDALSRAHHLIGQQISIEYVRSEGRTVRAYGPDGCDLGPLFARPPWHSTPHSLEMRQAAMRFHRNNLGDSRLASEDPIIQTIDTLATQAWRKGVASSIYLEFYTVLAGHLSKLNFESSTQSTAASQPTQADKNIRSVVGRPSSVSPKAHASKTTQLPAPRSGIVR